MPAISVNTRAKVSWETSIAQNHASDGLANFFSPTAGNAMSVTSPQRNRRYLRSRSITRNA